MKRLDAHRLARHYGAETIVETLQPYVSERRRARIEAALAGRLASVEVAIEHPYDPHNAAAVVRSAEALGAWAVHVIAAHERVLRAKRTTTGAHHWIETRHHSRLEEFLDARRSGMLIAAACVDATHMLEDLPIDGPICLLFGNEHTGLSPAAQQAADLRFRIPIYGFAESYNLSVSAALSLYSLTTRKRAALGRDGDLEPELAAVERARGYLRSVDERHARALFPAPG